MRLPALTLCFGLGVTLSLSSCSSGPDCKPEISKGTTFKVTVLSETPESDRCHVVDVPMISPFQIAADGTEPTASHPDCSVTPAAAPPAQMDVKIMGCVPGTSDMLSIFCKVEYPATCTGSMSFSFVAPKDKIVDWNAPVIDGVFFQVEDSAPGCLDNINNCFDQYLVRLERQN